MCKGPVGGNHGSRGGPRKVGPPGRKPGSAQGLWALERTVLVTLRLGGALMFQGVGIILGSSQALLVPLGWVRGGCWSLHFEGDPGVCMQRRGKGVGGGGESKEPEALHQH